MRPVYIGMLTASAFMTGLFSGRASITHTWIHWVCTGLYALNTAVWLLAMGSRIRRIEHEYRQGLSGKEPHG